MNQRILLPALVLGGVFAVVLTFIQSLLPSAEPLALFLANAGVMLIALTLYGVLMRRAAALDDAQQATAAPAARPRQDTRGKGEQSGRGRDRGRSGEGEDSGNRRDGGRRGNRGGRNRGDQAERSEAPQRAAASGPRESGEIKWFSGAKGYGFIIRPDGSEIFVHHRALRDRNRRDIPDGESVSYVIIERDKGPQADDVEVTGGLNESAA